MRTPLPILGSLLLAVFAAGLLGCAGDRALRGGADTAASTAGEPPTQLRWVDAQGGLTFRDGPGGDAASLAVIPDGSEVGLVEETGPVVVIGGVSGRWSRVAWEGRVGWVFGGYLVGTPRSARAEAPISPPTGGVATARFAWGDEAVGYYVLEHATPGWTARIDRAVGIAPTLTLSGANAVIRVPTPGFGVDETVEVARKPARIGRGRGIEVERIEYRIGGELRMVQYVTADWGLNISLQATTTQPLARGDLAVLETVAGTVSTLAADDARKLIAEE